MRGRLGLERRRGAAFVARALLGLVAVVAVGVAVGVRGGSAQAQVLAAAASTSDLVEGEAGAPVSYRPVAVEPRRRPLPRSKTAVLRSLPEVDPAHPISPADGERPIEHLRTRTGRRIVSVITYRNRLGERCMATSFGGGIGRGCGIPDPDPVTVSGPGAIGGGRTGPRWAVIVVGGLAASRVDSLRIVSTDCSVRPVEIDRDGVFLYVAGRDTIDRDVWPRRLLGYDRKGRLIHEQWLSVTRFRTPRDTWPTPRTPVRNCKHIR